MFIRRRKIKINRHKNKSIRSLVIFLIVTFLLLLISEIFLYFFSESAYIKVVLLGYFVSIFNIITGFVSLRWAFKRETKTFYIILYGGMALRFIIFIVALFWINNYTQLPLIGFVASFVFFYILMQYYEVRIINQELNEKQKIVRDDGKNSR